MNVEEDEFYLTLPSNSSMQYFPDNKTTNFVTQLPQQLKLDGQWEVALVEIQYPHSFYTVNDHENIIYYTLEHYGKKNSLEKTASLKKKTRIPAGNYDSINDVIHELNENKELDFYTTFTYNVETNRVTVDFKDIKNYIFKICSLKLSPKFSLQLGYEPQTNLFENRLARNPPNLLLGIPHQLFVYCDIVIPQLVGDVITPLLRVVPVNTSKYVYGSNKMVTYTAPHYIPVLKREFQNVEIDIRCDKGYATPFHFGTLCVKLHFRRRRSQ